MKRLVGWGSVMGFAAVAIGAFGAHVLKERLDPEAMDIYRTGVDYHMAHALALLLAALLAERLGNGRLAVWAGRCFLAGILLFSGSLYALALSGIKPLGAVTPLGGVAFLAGWGLLAVSAWKR